MIHVSGEHSPNVVRALELERQGRIDEYQPVTSGILSYEQYLLRKHTWRPAKVRTRLLGLFPYESQTKLFPPHWLDVAQQLGRKLREHLVSPECCKVFGHPFA